MVPRLGGHRAGRPRRRGVLRTADAEVRSHPDVRAARVSAFVAIVSACDEEHAGREGLGSRNHFGAARRPPRSEEHTSELQSRLHLVCRLLLEKKKKKTTNSRRHNTYH